MVKKLSWWGNTCSVWMCTFVMQDMDMWIDRAQSISRQRNGYDLLVCKIVNKIDLDPSLHIDTREHLLDLFNEEGVARFGDAWDELPTQYKFRFKVYLKLSSS